MKTETKEELERENEPQSQDNLIDVKKVIGDKNPRLLKMLPGFIIRYLKRTLHEDEMNSLIRESSHLFGLDFAERIIEYFRADLRVSGLENLPAKDRILVASNHPLGGLDGIALIVAAAKKRKDLLFPVNDLLMNVKNLKELFIPINKHGSNAENVAIFDRTFASDVAILYFPAGLVSRKQKKGIIKDLEWKKTFITKAKKSKRNIVPVHIDGNNTNFFYNLARFRKRLGLKQNIEMLYLVDEMYKQKDKIIHIRFGKAIPYETFDRRFTDAQWAMQVKEHVYSLEKDEHKEFTPRLITQ